MKRLALALFMSLSLAITGLAMAVARGQGQQPVGAEQIVICTGVGITTITIGPDGQPVETVHMCPDAMTQLAATFHMPPQPALQALRAARLVALPASPVHSRDILEPSARDPPRSA